MITIRELTESDMKQVVELRILCWTEELAGKAENDLSFLDELEFWTEWMNVAEENNDIRLLIGAFEDEKMLGIAMGSFAEDYDIQEKGIELNGLWVYPEHRSRGLSLMLLRYLLEFYEKIGMEKIVIYNHHYSPSNSFYIKFGAQVLKQEYQMDEKLLIDIFLVDISLMKENIKSRLKKHLT